MAMPVFDHGTSHNLPKSHIEAVLSVPPFKVTEPRIVRHVLVTNTDSVINPISKTLGGCYNIVLYYENLKEEDHDWLLAGWFVESLSMALLDYPLLAGRLHRREEHGDNMRLEIVSNDSGIRLYEAQFPMVLAEFLALSEKEHLEAELVFWKEIDEHNPEFSPLFYVQLTKFECGGYSIGISCSLLLADVLMVENFLKKWAKIHNNNLPQNAENKTPIFSQHLVRNHEPLPTDLITRSPSKQGAHSMIFKITSQGVSFNMELLRELAMLCVEKAEQELHTEVGSNFYVLMKESYEVIKVEGCSRSGHSMQVLKLTNQIVGVTWNDFGVFDLTFHEGNKPALVSHWIGSVADGHVMSVPCHEENVSAVIIVSLHTEKEL